ncbi:VOC family protein [Streptomyces sp. NBC_01220]|uniref:VOC family protein n=1 Tax=unclassified Streptomyces TaxID=2593676 RepID=UPI002E2A5EE4|nr:MULTISPECIES: VOC family protein [unclassified Streptomyces]WSQ44775.1 VOC family protein [Streptomyces sp. NBC_01220]
MNIIASAVLLTVGDPAASSRFFTGHLGFREVLVTDGSVHLSRDDAAADLVVLKGRPGEPAERESSAPADGAVSFTVTGLAAEHERLRREGARITMPLRQEPWGEWLMQLTDPNGVVVQLVEWIPPAGAGGL